MEPREDLGGLGEATAATPWGMDVSPKPLGAAELIKLRFHEVDFERGVVLVREGKGRKDHWHELEPRPGKPGKWDKQDDHYDPGDVICDDGEPELAPEPQPAPEAKPEQSSERSWSLPHWVVPVGAGLAAGGLIVGAILLAPETGGASLLALSAL